MRMWMLEPKCMCRKHLLGEHLENHMLVSSMAKGKKLDGFARNNLLEITSLKQRHEAIAEEMSRRGYNHKSPFDSEALARAINSQLYAHLMPVKINVQKSKDDIITRCHECEILWNKSPSEC